MDNSFELNKGDVVQISPDCKNAVFAECFMIVSEPKSFGAQGYVQAFGENGKPGGQAYLRINFADIEYIGRAAWAIGEEEENADT